MSTAIVQARKKLEQVNARARKAREKAKKQQSDTICQLATLAGGVAAALVDDEMGDGGPDDVATWGDTEIPVAGSVGAGLVIAGVLSPSMPYSREVAHAGLGMATASVYALVRERYSSE